MYEQCYRNDVQSSLVMLLLKTISKATKCAPYEIFFERMLFFYIPIKIYNADLLYTLLTEYLTTLQGRCHWVQNTMTSPWHHKKLRRFTYELQKEKKYKT